MACHADNAHAAKIAVEAAFAAIGRVDRLMHPSRIGSDLLAIRQLVEGSAVVDPWTWAVLRAATQLHVESNGLFDPCRADSAGRIGDLRLDEPNRVESERPLAIDLGGIAKGFAVDRAIDALRDHGCAAAEVNAGGDLRVFGADACDVWVRAGGACRPIRLRDSACAVSDATAIEPPPEHLGYLRRGAAETNIGVAGSAVILAPAAMWADGLATYAMVCRSPAELARFRAVLEAHDARRLDIG